MVRSNRSGVSEVAHIRGNRDSFNEGFDRIFKPSKERRKKELEEDLNKLNIQLRDLNEKKEYIENCIKELESSGA